MGRCYALFLILSVTFMGCVSPPAEPCAEAFALAADTQTLHQRRPVSDWIERASHLDPATSHEAMRALGDLGAPSLCYANGLLQRQDPMSRHAGAEICRRVAREAHQTHRSLISALAPSLRQGLLGALQDPDAHVRSAALGALGSMGDWASDAAGIMTDSLGDDEWFVRYSAVRALADLGSPAIGAVGTLSQMEHHDPDPRVREVVSKAIVEIWHDHALVTRHTSPHGGGLHRTAPKH